VAFASNKGCYALPAKTYSLSFTGVDFLSAVTLAPGDVMGYGTTGGNLACSNTSDIGSSFILQMVPKSRAVYGSTVCATNVSGIGVRFLSSAGNPIACNSWAEIVRIAEPKINTSYLFSVKVFELVRTSEALPEPGAYPLILGGSIASQWPGDTNSTTWGTYTLSGSNSVILRSCSLLTAVQTVTFGRSMKGEQVERPFDIRLGNCGTEQVLNEVKNYSNIRFESALITPDGRLANSSCSTCATDTYIEVQDSSGAILNLANKVALTDSQVLGGTLIKSFKAILKPGSNQGGGVVSSYLNFIVDYN
jgi:hypothetical protein